MGRTGAGVDGVFAGSLYCRNTRERAFGQGSPAGAQLEDSSFRKMSEMFRSGSFDWLGGVNDNTGEVVSRIFLLDRSVRTTEGDGRGQIRMDDSIQE